MKLLPYVVTAIAVALPMTAIAQPYPSKAVTIIVPYAAGGETDAIARVFAARLPEDWKRTVVVDAAREAWRVQNDRYTGGLSSHLDVLVAEDTSLANLRTLSDLRSRAFTLDVALVRALGGGYTTAAL